MKEKNIFCLWSGGVTSHLSLYYAKKMNKVSCLVANNHSNSISYTYSGINPSLLRSQAKLLNIPLLIFTSSPHQYKENFKDILHSLKKYNVTGGVFGYVSHQEMKESALDICQNQNIKSYFPLWEGSKEKILTEFLALGFRAKIVAVHEKTLMRNLLGRDIDNDLIAELKQRKVDICAENGEYHTFVYEGPLFKEKMKLNVSEPYIRNDYWTIDLM